MISYRENPYRVSRKLCDKVYKSARLRGNSNIADPERECRFNFPRALPELAAVIRKEGKSYYIFETARNDSLMNHFNPAIILGWLANIDISPCTSLQAVITYAAKYCSKSEKKTESYCKLADQVLPHTAHHQPLLSFSSRLMNKLIAERDYSAQEISHLLLNIPLQEGTRMVVYVDCRPLEQHVRSYRVDEDVSEAIGSYRNYLQRDDQHESITYLEYLQSYNLKRWWSAEASPRFHDFCRVKLMMAHSHRSPEELLAVDGQRFESFAAAYQCCRQRHHLHEDDHYGEVGANELQAEDDEFEREEHEEPGFSFPRLAPFKDETQWSCTRIPKHPSSIFKSFACCMIFRCLFDGILHGDFWKQRKAENPLHLDVDHQPLEARDSLNPEQRLVGTPVWRAAPTGVAGNQISGSTLHSLLHLPINKDFKPLSAIDKAQLQKQLKDIKYLIVDEKSMLGLRQLSWIDDRLREAFPNRNEEFFGDLNILLVGD
ncbi:hypothetical protein HIM_10728 [Hirsutella minnesotensis 3608]|uniref:ATP-dependent DNA helicase n=1 Tax=Hirsutella minnesotensis 3608 TaxID=1043627 RepID=A0A0F7ZRM5_9HYPO|nr:hypothetical protein HIM_10728 [Hirsutella minnesotensis 3608]